MMVNRVRNLNAYPLSSLMKAKPPEMAGRMVVVKTAVGDEVVEGQELAVMVAMKMELSLKSPRAGKIAGISVAAGDFVEADMLLIKLEALS